eukprot:CAMPEP_0176198846 /NCGR_PEP_ID=MMETSP0121_2-20121125/8259_1 /TAXON_ID=160619 /ORGANISM="Kryptoperidinium foliaceum, Strain CCMP 1326" /LENGTH=423 /DNA_ID=CAMNT_0017537701 /DNA_START=79 /DNA_END=1347 /DNA_ORIENTATION=+
MERVVRIAGHVRAASDEPAPLLSAEPTAALSGAQPSDDDVVICCAVRTGVTRAKKGPLKDTPCEDMLVPLLKAIVERTKIDPKKIGDAQIGNVLQPTAGGATSRMSMFLASLPYDIPCAGVNRQCASSLQAAANIATSIKTGVIDVGIAGGVESMSMYPMTSQTVMSKTSPNVEKHELAAACLIPMGVTSENVAAKYGISREVQDRMAVESNAKAVAAQKNGWFDSEIVPFTTIIKQKDGSMKEVTVSADDGPREGTTMESLAKLKPVFKAGGSTTAGNASQMSDGASMILMARRSAAKALGLPILARMRSFACVGVDPRLMGIGPAFAIPVALERAGLKSDDIDIYEVNEAFASQATMTIEHVGIPKEKLNPKGGAIALGHALGCTGCRQIASLLPELKRTGKKLGVTAMCMGSGMGAAAVW